MNAIVMNTIGLFVALSQVDFMMIRMPADLMVNYYTCHGADAGDAVAGGAAAGGASRAKAPVLLKDDSLCVRVGCCRLTMQGRPGKNCCPECRDGKPHSTDCNDTENIRLESLQLGMGPAGPAGPAGQDDVVDVDSDDAAAGPSMKQLKKAGH